jgi:hypothetical protein
VTFPRTRERTDSMAFWWAGKKDRSGRRQALRMRSLHFDECS